MATFTQSPNDHPPIAQSPADIRPAPATGGPAARRIRRGWVLEAAVVLALYEIYDWARDQVQGPSGSAFRNAKQVIHVERVLGLYQERVMQGWVLPHHVAVSFWNLWYGTIHFVMPAVALVWLYCRVPVRYVLWRNTFLFMLVLSIVGFWLYPLMPPRLLPQAYGFVDTPAKFFGFGKPTANSVKEYGNLYAAMPSLHVGWSTWTVLALYPLLHRWWARALLVAYPVGTLFAITVTGNHFLLDAVGGWIVLAVAYGLAVVVDRGRERRAARAATPPSNRSFGQQLL
jgi:hypothetical protein